MIGAGTEPDRQRCSVRSAAGERKLQLMVAWVCRSQCGQVPDSHLVGGDQMTAASPGEHRPAQASVLPNIC